MRQNYGSIRQTYLTNHKGIRKASQSSSADTILQLRYAPGTVVKEAEPAGRVASAITPALRM